MDAFTRAIQGREREMITLLFWCVLNGFLFHFAPSVMTENTKILIVIICTASDLNLITTLLNKK